MHLIRGGGYQALTPLTFIEYGLGLNESHGGDMNTSSNPRVIDPAHNTHVRTGFNIQTCDVNGAGQRGAYFAR